VGSFFPNKRVVLEDVEDGCVCVCVFVCEELRFLLSEMGYYTV